MYKLRKPPPDARILKIRENEEKLARMGRSVKEQQNLDAKATWECTTDRRIKHNIVQAKFQELRAKRAARIDERRGNLAMKLRLEEEAFQRELEESAETPEERRAKLANRARELKAMREAERLKLRDELLEQHFRENCDPLRAKLSQRVLYKTVDERNCQIQEKMRRKILEGQEQHMLQEMYEMERMKKEQRYLDDQKRHKEQSEDLLRGLNEQLRYLNEQQQIKKEEDQHEIDAMHRHWQQLAEEKRQEEERERERSTALAKDVKAFNKMKQAELDEIARKHREEDVKFLHDSLAREAEAERKEKQVKHERREEMRQYRLQLCDQLAKEEEGNADYEAAIRTEYELKMAREDAVRKAQHDARQRLADEVHEVRQQQIQEKHRNLMAAAEASQLERMRLQEDASQLKMVEEAAKADARKDALEQRLALEAQIVSRAQRKAAEEHDRLMELQATRDAEAKYSANIEQALRAEPPAWFGRKKVEWFH